MSQQTLSPSNRSLWIGQIVRTRDSLPETFLLTEAADCGSANVFLLRMIAEDKWTDIEHAVDRTEAAVIEEATAIAQLRRQVALVIEALEKLELCKFQGMENHPQGGAARDRYREILQQLKASYAAKK